MAQCQIAFYEDSLRGGARGADAVYGSLVEVNNKGVSHVVVFVVDIEDYVKAGLGFASDGFPEGFVARSVRRWGNGRR
jgi:hypothetical protein